MGVTLARKAIKGGTASDLLASGSYELGASIANRIETFIGIAGANWGLTDCFKAATVPTCAATNGFFPGFGPGFGLSSFLADIDEDQVKAGKKVFSIYSVDDDVIGYGGIVWGRLTSQVPLHDGEIVFRGQAWTHLGVRDIAGPLILHLINTRSTDGYMQPLKKYCKDVLGYQFNTYSVKRVGGLPVHGEKA